MTNEPTAVSSPDMAGSRKFFPITLALLALSTGCASHKPAQLISQQSIEASEDSVYADQLWTSAETTLRLHRYQLDRIDRNDGIITTLPEPSQHITEPWRSDVHTWRDLMESTINPIRRWVEVQFHKAESGEWSSIEVIVHKERLSSPDRQFNNTGAAYAFFGYSLPSTTGLAKITPEHDAWVALGRDATTESFILSEIVERAGQVAPKGN